MITTVVTDCAALTNWHEILPAVMDDLGNRILASWSRHEEFLFRSDEHLVLGNKTFILGDSFTDIDLPDVMVGILAQQQKRHGFIPNNLEETLSLAHIWFEHLLCMQLRPYEQALQPIRSLRSDEYKYNVAFIVTPAQQKALANSELAQLFPESDMIVVEYKDHHEGVHAHQQAIESALVRFSSKPALTVVFCATKNTAQAAVRAGIEEVIGYANGWSGQDLLQSRLHAAGVKMIVQNSSGLLSRMQALGGYAPPQPYRKWELSRL